jgi:inorganic pyrophosphatase/exopolyphosphatase
MPARRPVVHVTGHRNPDTDSIASGIGYAELKGRLDSDALGANMTPNRSRHPRGAPRRATPDRSGNALRSREPERRRVLLVDHAEQARSVPGVEDAEITEILDHHHIGSIETSVPVTATFDLVGSTATLVIERFRQNGMEPSRPTATMLLGALLSDTVILNSPTTTERDRSVTAYLERVLALDAIEFGSATFEETSDVSEPPAEEIISRDAKEYEAPGGQTICIAQVETVGRSLLDRRDELLAALGADSSDCPG